MNAQRSIIGLLLFVTAAAPTFAEVRDVTVPAGTLLRVRLQNTVGSDTSRVEDPVRGQLVDPIVVDGQTVVPAGSAVTGLVTQARRWAR